MDAELETLKREVAVIFQIVKLLGTAAAAYGSYLLAKHWALSDSLATAFGLAGWFISGAIIQSARNGESVPWFSVLGTVGCLWVVILGLPLLLPLGGAAAATVNWSKLWAEASPMLTVYAVVVVASFLWPLARAWWLRRRAVPTKELSAADPSPDSEEG